MIYNYLNGTQRIEIGRWMRQVGATETFNKDKCLCVIQGNEKGCDKSSGRATEASLSIND